MEATGASPAVALSKVAAVMPWARAVTRASVRKASNLPSPELGRPGAGRLGMVMAGCAGGGGLGAVVAQAMTIRVPHMAARRCKPLRRRVRRIIAKRYTALEDFWRKTALFCGIWRVDRGGGLA